MIPGIGWSGITDFLSVTYEHGNGKAVTCMFTVEYISKTISHVCSPYQPSVCEVLYGPPIWCNVTHH